VIRDIRVEGAQRTDVGTVFGYLPLRVGDHYDPGKGIAAIRPCTPRGCSRTCGSSRRRRAGGRDRGATGDPAIELVGMKEFDKTRVKKS